MKETIEEFKYQLALLYVVGVFFLMTFYSHNAYYDMSQAKVDVALKVSFVYLAVMGVLWVVTFMLEKNNTKKSLKDRLDIIDIAVLLFLAAVAISVLVSNDRYAALWGSEGFGMGAVLMFLLGGVYFVLSRNLKFSKIILLSVIISGYILFLIGITDGLGLDIFMWRHHIGSDPRDYISTIGHRDWLVGYLGLTLPFVAVCYMQEKNKPVKVAYWVYLFLGFINLYLTRSDGALLVFGCAVPLVYMALGNKEYWKKVWYIVIAFVAASLGMQTIQIILGEKVLSDAVLGWLLDHYIIYMLLPLAILAICLSNKIIKLNLKKLWIAFTVLVIVVMAVMTITHFDGNIGTHRGFIWMYGVGSFAQFDPLHKLFGWGADCFNDAIYLFKGDMIAQTWPENNRIANAHNEVLQYLVTAGIFGMLAYIGIYIAAIVKAVKKRTTSYISLAAIMSLWTYFCTALVNNPQGLNYAILFCILAFARNDELTENKKMTE